MHIKRKSAAAGYVGFAGIPDFSRSAEPEETEIPSTVEVTSGEVKQTIITPGQLVNFSAINIASGISGLVEAVYVRPGDKVEEDQLLVEFDQGLANDNLLQAQRSYLELVSPASIAAAEEALAVAKQDLVNARYRLEYIISPTVFSWEQQLENAQTQLEAAKDAYNQDDTAENEQLIKDAESELSVAERGLKQARYYYENEYIYSTFEIITEYNEQTQKRIQYVNKPSELKIEEIRALYNLAKERVSEAETYLEALRTDSIPEDATGEDIVRLEQAILELEDARQALEATKIYAPFSGTILDLEIRVGETVGEGTKLMQMADPHALEVVVSVVEEDYPLIEVGQSVELFFDAAPEEEVVGKIDRIIPKRVSSERALYQVYISIDEIPETVVDGMTADAEIILAKYENVLRLPRALVQARSDGTAVVGVWVGDRIEQQSDYRRAARRRIC